MDEHSKPASFAWDRQVPEFGELWLRAEDDLGYPTQTWLNGVLLRREPRGEFAWDTERGVPLPVSVMESLVDRYDSQTACYLLKAEIELWDRYVRDSSYATWFRARAAAYVNHGRELCDRLSC